MNEPEIVLDWAMSFVREHDAALNRALKRVQKKPRAVGPIHELRLTLSRYKAALEDFSSCLPLLDLYDLVAELHKKSGKVRNADVLLEHVEAFFERAGEAECDELVKLHAELRSRRKDACKRLRRALRRNKRAPQAPDARIVPIDTHRGTDEATYRIVTVRTAEVLVSSQDFSADGERLHAFRLSIKRLRYALERFAVSLPQFAGAGEYLEALGDELGNAHDLLALEDFAVRHGAELARSSADCDAAVERAALLWRTAIAPRGPLAGLIAYVGFNVV
ncbi:MAG: CHAD domain-containing protein [Candidatus Eremiobacteraeota bacterium]|nr:CHAD domain-containing protein [Candidatus Eremiobacteraeota bacterium]